MSLSRKSLLATMSIHESTLTLEFKCSAKYKGKVYTEKLLKEYLKALIKKDQEENQL